MCLYLYLILEQTLAGHYHGCIMHAAMRLKVGLVSVAG